MDNLTCDMCGKSDRGSIQQVKKVWICNDCMDDLYPYYEVHLIVKRTMSICNQIEKKIRSIEG